LINKQSFMIMNSGNGSQCDRPQTSSPALTGDFSLSNPDYIIL